MKARKIGRSADAEAAVRPKLLSATPHSTELLMLTGCLISFAGFGIASRALGCRIRNDAYKESFGGPLV